MIERGEMPEFTCVSDKSCSVVDATFGKWKIWIGQELHSDNYARSVEEMGCKGVVTRVPDHSLLCREVSVDGGLRCKRRSASVVWWGSSGFQRVPGRWGGEGEEVSDGCRERPGSYWLSCGVCRVPWYASRGRSAVASNQWTTIQWHQSTALKNNLQDRNSRSTTHTRYNTEYTWTQKGKITTIWTITSQSPWLHHANHLLTQ